MENKTFYNEILTEHNLHPYHKHKLEDANLVLEGVNPSCGDDIFLELKVEDGVVVDGAFEGDGCAISQASADMMLELVIGRSKEEALHLADLFLKMIRYLPNRCVNTNRYHYRNNRKHNGDNRQLPIIVKHRCYRYHSIKQ